MQNTKKKKTARNIILITAAVIIVAVAAWAIVSSRNQHNDQTSQGIVLDENAEAWDGNMNDLSGGKDGIKIPGYGELTVPKNDSTWNITLANPKDNHCYFRYTITVNDDTLYKSDLIEPGKAIKQFKVSKRLDPGDYEIYLKISTYSMDDDLTPMNGANIKSVLHVI
ncbi:MULTISPECIES: hypothetical protein [Anaerostipes]|uniref:Uncharacterized protein n=1 Tax=Anaerostipes butyraticus TaxID=645466 RepID=A0A916QC94_9FIRM|nr:MULTISPECIES: hypothetical protein [Anaerostipes]GFO85983.1 hypothetical protein ANBU17_23300 [Anaerostipes butyraticus]HJC82040.1 hypothetical protein [Candidatus Anaerostipes avicola]